MPMPNKKESGYKLDAITSFNQGVGTFGRDQTRNFSIPPINYLNRNETDQLYASIPFCRRACDAPPQYAFRKWGNLTIQNKEDYHLIEAIRKKFSRYLQSDSLDVKFYFTRAQIQAHKQGGCGIVMLIDDGNMDKFDQPVKLNKVKAVRGLRLFDGNELTPEDTYYQEGQFEPEYYRLGAGQILDHKGNLMKGTTRIHCSRVLPFISGAPLSKQLGRQISNGWWGDSVIRQCYEAAQWYIASNQAIAHALQSFEVTNVQIKGLIDRINSSAIEGRNYSKAVESRMESVLKLFTTFGMLVTDMDDEKVEHTSRQFANVDKMIESLERLLIATTNLPKFILFREYGSQLGQLGEHEQNDFDLLIGQEQSRVEPNLYKLLTYVLASKEFDTKGNIPENFGWQWNSLREKTSEQIAQERKLDAETFEKYIALGVLTPQEVRQSVFGGTEYSNEINIDDEENNIDTPTRDRASEKIKDGNINTR